MRKIQKGKTVKQIAVELEVSKQAVMYRIKKLEATKGNGFFTTKENGVLYLSLSAETLLKSSFTQNDQQTDTDKQQTKSNKQPTKDSEDFDGLLKVLQSTIDTLQQQLEIKDNQIEKLTDAIRAEQTLHAESKGMLQTASTKFIEDGSKNENIGKFRKKLIEMLGG